MKGTLCFWDRKGNSSDQEWVLVKKKERRKNVFKKILKFCNLFPPNSWLAQLHLLRIRAAVVHSTSLSTVLSSLTLPGQVMLLVIAGSNDSVFQFDSGVETVHPCAVRAWFDFSAALALPPARQWPDAGLRQRACCRGHCNTSLHKASGAVSGVSCAPSVRCFRGDRNLEEGVVGVRACPSPVAEESDLEVGIEGARARPSQEAGESCGIIGLREVSESDPSLHISRVSNSLNSLCGC